VFWWEWPEDIKNNIKTLQNPKGKISKSDLKMAGLLMLWLVIEGVCNDLCKKLVTLFSNNLPKGRMGDVAHVQKVNNS
jgi:hypothetical protein